MKEGVDDGRWQRRVAIGGRGWGKGGGGSGGDGSCGILSGVNEGDDEGRGQEGDESEEP